MAMTREEAEAALMAAVERNSGVITLTRGGGGAEAAVRAALRQVRIAELEAISKAWPQGCMCHTCKPLHARIVELKGEQGMSARTAD